MEHNTKKRPEVPNEETIAAMKEVEEVAKHPERFEVCDRMGGVISAVEEEN